MRIIVLACALATVAAPAAPAMAKPSVSPATTKAAYTVEASTIGTLMDDPVSKAILARHLPAIVSNPQFQMARSMTLADIAPMSGGAITTDAMKAINADLKSAAPN